jgi:hypothetical protein
MSSSRSFPLRSAASTCAARCQDWMSTWRGWGARCWWLPRQTGTYDFCTIRKGDGMVVDDGDEFRGRWYVPNDGDSRRYADPAGGLPSLHFIDYQDSHGEWVIRLCEDSTGLLVGPKDHRLPGAGIYSAQLRGEKYYEDSATRGDFRPRAPLEIVREQSNPYDSYAVAVQAKNRAGIAGYVNKQKARWIAKKLDNGARFSAVSFRGTAAGCKCPQIGVVIAAPEVIEHLLSPRPKGAATPVPPTRVLTPPH